MQGDVCADQSALAAHGYQRATTDIDIVFPATAAAGQRVKEALMILPDQAAKELEPQWFEEVSDRLVIERALAVLRQQASGTDFREHRSLVRTAPITPLLHRQLQ